MAKVLFIDGCARGWEVSRTYAVAEKFMRRYSETHPEDEIQELHLAEEHLSYLTGPSLDKRNKLLEKGAQTSEAFGLARQFAQADKIFLSAPFWDMSFPALVKVYIEVISVNGITFGYDQEGRTQGLCRAEKLFYLTTSGDEIDLTSDKGSVLSYLRSLCDMYGIGLLEHLWLQGLDLKEADVEKILTEGCARAEELAEHW